MTPIAVVEEALTEGRALFSAAEDLRALFKRGRAEIEALNAEAGGTVEGMLSQLRSGLDAFKAVATKVEAPEPEMTPTPQPETLAEDGKPAEAPATATPEPQSVIA